MVLIQAVRLCREPMAKVNWSPCFCEGKKINQIPAPHSQLGFVGNQWRINAFQSRKGIKHKKIYSKFSSARVSRGLCCFATEKTWLFAGWLNIWCFKKEAQHSSHHIIAGHFSADWQVSARLRPGCNGKLLRPKPCAPHMTRAVRPKTYTIRFSAFGVKAEQLTIQNNIAKLHPAPCI